MGFEMSVHEAATGYIVYSIYLDDELRPYARAKDQAEPQVPTLDYFVAKARELGVELPKARVDAIHARAVAGLAEKGWGSLNGHHFAETAAA